MGASAAVKRTAERILNKLKADFQGTDFSICTDIWADCSHSSYLGINVNTIDVATFLPRTTFIGLQKLKGSHTSEKILQAVSDLLSTVDLDLQHCNFVVTDNASNMVCAFKDQKESKFFLYKFNFFC